MTSEAKQETPKAAPKTIVLEIEDIRAGLNIVGQATTARARLQVLSELESELIQRLAAKYGADLQSYHLHDWLTGFEPNHE